MNHNRVVASVIVSSLMLALSGMPAYAGEAKDTPANPCAPRAANPCSGTDGTHGKKTAGKGAANPCEGKNPCAGKNPCGGKNPCMPKH